MKYELKDGMIELQGFDLGDKVLISGADQITYYDGEENHVSAKKIKVIIEVEELADLINENCDEYLSNEEGSKKANELVNELINDMSKKVNSYIIWIARFENIQLDIVQDVNRPNNPDDYEIIAEYIENNYGRTSYEVIEVEDLKKIRL